MTDEEKYAVLLRELGGLLAEKELEISLLKYQLESAKKKLYEAEIEVSEDQEEEL